ncbi:MAG: Asp-tRNA(Asn)/Glu-tRNA(Gln) amidotransferase GatCAB subunit B, partial [Chloroflexi bacterium]|nr:Asp-tRNA(Asn)/Glu-tRNA(Gln) amidotransferase GatCAB subunit B [Chloroflexota bacterium]
STGNMEEGSFRCDANISMRRPGDPLPNWKVEVKNMNSFRAVYHALQYEIERQATVLREGGAVAQETRGWVEELGEAVSQRSKEFAHDYRYFPEPDLPPLECAPKWVEGLRARLPELPDAKLERFITQYGLPRYDAALLTSTQAMADFFEAAARQPVAVAAGARNEESRRQRAKAASNWCLGELNRLLNLNNVEVQQTRLTPQALGELLDLLDAGQIGQTAAKTVFEEMFTTGQGPREIVQKLGLLQISNADELSGIVEKVLAGNAQAVTDYRSGKEQALGFLVGQVMRETRGRANPATVTGLLREKLS